MTVSWTVNWGLVVEATRGTPSAKGPAGGLKCPGAFLGWAVQGSEGQPRACSQQPHPRLHGHWLPLRTLGGRACHGPTVLVHKQER